MSRHNCCCNDNITLICGLHTGIANSKPRSVWPEDSADGDKRIREQMVYVPNGYRYEEAPIKRILIYTGLGSDWEKPRLDGEEFAGCPVSRCSFTVDKSHGSEVDAVLFRHAYTRPEFKRPANQVNHRCNVIITI